MIRWRRLGLWASMLACAALLGVTLVRVAERGRFARPYSTYGSGAQGTRALFLLLGELGYPVLRWSQDLARLPARSTLIALGSCQSPAARPLSRYERVELTGFVERGGVLLVAGARNYLPPELGVRFEDDPECDAADEPGESAPPEAARAPHPEPDPDATAAEPPPSSRGDVSWGVPLAPALAGLPIVPFDKPGKLIVEDFTLAEPLLSTPEPRQSGAEDMPALAITFTRGRGRVIVLSSASMLQNRSLDGAEGAPLLTRLLHAYANRELLIFDEYHLGLGERRSLMQYLRNAGAMPLFAQILCALGVWLWRRGARLGTPRPARRDAGPLGTTSFVTALGGLYQRVGDRGAAIRLIARAALLRVARHHALGSLQARALERELTRRGAVRAAQAVREIVSAGSAAPAEPLPAIVRRIDASVATALED